jgi:hypothetical protein
LDGLEVGLQVSSAKRITIMKTNSKLFAVLLGAIVCISLSGCQKSSTPEPGPSSGVSPEEQAILNKTKQLAVETLGLKLDGSVDAGHKDNFSGLRTENITFTQRLDSRTFIAYDKRFSDAAKTGIYKESDEALAKRTREILDRLKIPATEIAAVKVVQEQTRLGERDPKTGKIKMEPAEPGKKWAWTAREINGVPVFSSRATVALNPSGEIGFLEVHWPEIPAKTLEEARRYGEVATKKWHAPELKGARIESVTAGILHSPPAGTALDFVPVVRVIYAPVDKRIGKKPVAYLDLEGKPVAMPRALLQPPREELKTEREKPSAR